MSLSFKYAFAVKDDRKFCIKYDEDWEKSCIDYLHDKGYVLTPAGEQHWNRHIDEDGSSVACYLLDEDLKEFDVGTY